MTALRYTVLIYPDVRQAVDWLCAAFGFEERLQIGENHRSQLRIGDGAVILGDVHNDCRLPQPGEITHQVMVRIEDANAHFQRAREHGARIRAGRGRQHAGRRRTLRGGPLPRAGRADRAGT